MPTSHPMPTSGPSPAALRVVEQMRRVNPQADPLALLPEVDPVRIPRHIAIIMDGNGRWAQERGLPRVAGHRSGAEAVRRTLEGCSRLGVETLTLYSFSSENWKRPREEVEALMGLYRENLLAQREDLLARNIRFRQIGSREGLPESVLDEVDRTIEATSHCTGPILCLAVNYGGRRELVEAARALAARAVRGELAPDAIDEHALAGELYTAGLPDPDLLIRTGGEMRVSNFLLWQISYAEIHVADVHWPDFDFQHLLAAVRDYASRNRRYGGVDEPSELHPTPIS